MKAGVFGFRPPSGTLRVSRKQALEHAGNIVALPVSDMCVECKHMPKDDTVWCAKNHLRGLQGSGVLFEEKKYDTDS